MIKINITESIIKEFLKSIVNKNCKISQFKLNEIEITYNYIKFKDKKCKFLSNIQKFLDIFKTSSYKVEELLLGDIFKISKQHPIIENTIVKNAYDTLRNKWGHKLINLTKIDVCPYCNRNYIFNFNKTQTTVELDHFFPKSNYPHLALNIYNLIPSCHTCNNHKNNDTKLHFYPYEENFNDSVKFKYKYNNLSDIEIEFDIKNNVEKAKNHIEIFNLEHLYNKHKDIVLELIQKREIYSDTYINELTTQYPNMFNNKEDVLRLITCGYVDDKDLHKRPLSKLIKDISEELGFL